MDEKIFNTMNAIVIFNSVCIAAQPESMHVVHYSLSKYTYECMDGFATEGGANPDTFFNFNCLK